MHYKNGRAAQAGDKIVSFTAGVPLAGILHSPSAQSETCNGRLALTTHSDPWINIKDCLHIDDILAALSPDPPS